MVEMEYRSDRKNRNILDMGEYKGYRYYVMNLGTHPCAYVEIPKGHKYFGINEDDANIDCHGGLTYASDYLCVGENPIHGWFIGWDYAHYGDYVGYAGYYEELYGDQKRYSTRELIYDCHKVIEQLVGEDE